MLHSLTVVLLSDESKQSTASRALPVHQHDIVLGEYTEQSIRWVCTRLVFKLMLRTDLTILIEVEVMAVKVIAVKTVAVKVVAAVALQQTCPTSLFIYQLCMVHMPPWIAAHVVMAYSQFDNFA